MALTATRAARWTPTGVRPAFRVEDLFRIYREGAIETVALRGIDLVIEADSFVAIMGRSGSGKSTLLGLLAGTDRPSAGRVLFGDLDLGRATEDELQRLRGRHIGLLFQADNLVPFLDVGENMELAAKLAGGRLDEDDRDAVLERVGLAARRRHRPGQLSGGEQQRAALGCVVASAAPVLLMDEPTAELDSKTASAILDLVAELGSENQLTIVLATHDAAVAARAERVVTLGSGSILDDRRTP